MIGKESEFLDVVAWTKSIENYVQARGTTRYEKSSKGDKAFPTKTVPIAETKHSDSSSLTHEVLTQIETREMPNVSDAIPPPRVYVLSGSFGYGKSYLIEKLVELKRVYRWTFWRLASEASGPIVDQYDSSITSVEAPSQRTGFVDPKPSVIDRFVEAWDQMSGHEHNIASVLVVDNFEDLNDKQHGFLEYISKRIRIEETGFEPETVYVLVTGTHPKLEDFFTELFGMKQVINNTLLPLKESEIRGAIDRLRGRHVTSDDRRNLESFLLTFREDPGAIPTALVKLMQHEILTYSSGQWRFHSSEVQHLTLPEGSLSDYYKQLPSELPNIAREVLNWIVCHDGKIPIHRIAEVSGIPLVDVYKAIEAIAPHRILEVSGSNENRSIGLVHQRAKSSFYDAIDKRRREYIHDKYIITYEHLDSFYSNDDPMARIFVRRQLIYHYSATGADRALLSNVIRVARDLMIRQQYFDLRSFCNESLTKLSEMTQHTVSSPAESVKRYLLKQLVETNWMLDDYDSLKTVAQKAYGPRYSYIPLSIAFKYCLSLIFHSEFDLASSVTGEMKKRYSARKCQAYNTASIIDAYILIQTGRLKSALSLSNEIERHARVLTQYQQCRLYSGLLIIYERLSDEDGIRNYVPVLEDITLRNGFHHEFQFCLLAPFNFAFNRSLLSECKQTARRAISIAARARSYRRLVDWYLRASAVYYEDGSYNRSIRYLNKALPLAERLGLVDDIASLVVRLAMNYLSAGAYGNAIIHVNRALHAWSKDHHANVGAVIHLFAFETHLVAKSKYTDQHYKHATQYMKRHKGVQRWGFYWYLVGMYKHRIGDLSASVKALRSARGIFEREGATDDAVRSAFKEVIALLDMGRRSEASMLLGNIASRIPTLESANLKAEYWATKLSYQYSRRARKSVLKRYLKYCEDALVEAREVPLLLYVEKTIIRVKARIGDTYGAQVIFKSRLKRIKTILSNMPSREYAQSFLVDDDEQLLISEFRLLKEKGAQTGVPPMEE